jgi:serine acetyltransferase
MSLLKDLSQDIAFYHRLRFPGRQPTLFSRTRALLSSRGLFVLAAHRITYRCTLTRPSGRMASLLNLAKRVFLRPGYYIPRVLAKSEIVESSRIEAGVYLSDRGHMILGASSIGAGTIIHDHVTIGMNKRSETPEIGPNVWIGPRCVLYGSIQVGAGATLLPDTVLTKSVPPGAVVQGNPARVLERELDTALLRCSLFSEITAHLS